MEIVIRKAMEEDLGALLEVQKKAFLVQAEKYDAFDIPPMVEEKKDIDLKNPNLTVLIAEIDGVIAGSIRLLKEGDGAEIKRLSVLGEYQNLGIGTKLMQEIEEFSYGVERLWLFTGGQSKKNIELYLKLGFRVFKEEPFKDNFTLVYMEKLI